MASDANLHQQQASTAFPPETPPGLASSSSYHDQVAAAQHQHQQQQQQQQLAQQHHLHQQQQQQAYMQQRHPNHPPSTPLSHASPQSVTSPSVKISPDTLASLTGVGSAASAAQASSPFSGGGSVISPTGSSFSTAGHLGGGGTGGGLGSGTEGAADGAGFSRTAAMALAGAMGMSSAPTMQPSAAGSGGGAGPMSLAGMDVDLGSFATPPHSGPSSTGGSTPSNGSGPPYYAFQPQPGASTSVPSAQQLAQSNLPPPSHPAPTLGSAPRHHPYAHPSRPGLTSSHSQTSISGLPHYLSASAGASPASSAGGPTPSPGPPPSATPEPPSNSGGAGGPFALGLPGLSAAQVPPRVHSAPGHILSLSTSGLDGHGHGHGQALGHGLGRAGSPHPHPSADPDSMGAQQQHRFLNGIEQQQQPLSAISMGGGDGSVTGNDMLLMSTNSAPSSTTPGLGSGPGPGGLAPPFGTGPGGGSGGGGALTIDTLQASKVMSSLTAPQSAPATTTLEDDRLPPGAYNDSVRAAISLLQKRLPIMGAALSSSEAESGQDEEEIWKGIEGAYEELKRIMRGRRDTRRHQGIGSASSKRAVYTMELESPVTPIDRDRPSFLGAPPLVHSHSTPDVGIAAQASAARQAATAQMQQQQHAAQLQMQAQAQVQAEAHARAQAQLQAEADRARAEAEQRARAEEDARQQMENEQHMRAEAEAKAVAEQQRAEQAIREAEQYQQQVMQAEQMMQAEQLRLARERLHQHMQEGAAGAPQTLPNPPVEMQQSQSQGQQPPPQQQQQQQQQSQQQQQHVGLDQQQQQQQSAQLAYANPNPFGQLQPQQGMPMGALPTSSIPTNGLSQSLYPSHVGSQHGTPQPSSAFSPYPGGFDPVADLTMQQLQQMQGLPGYPLGGVQQQQQQQQQQAPLGDSVDPASLGGIAPSTVSPPSAGPSAFASLSNSSGPGPVRQSRSRAASQSGYTSSGSRSRAASGSGYQVLLESRSRAASSASSVYQTFERDEEDDEGEDGADFEHEIDVGGNGPASARSSQMGAASAGVDQDTKARMDPVFVDFLASVCSNLDATDSKGEPIHQTLMAKKMEKLDQSHDFRPFKFRIQAFTNAFAEALARSGAFDSEVPVKKVRQYLWAQPYISRFNDDGKKAKSKGNHIWTVEAKKMPDKKWLFREFTRCIKGAAPSVAFVGLTWQWAPRVWDPQCSSAAIDASFMSPSLPEWLAWDDNVLQGEVPESALGQTLEVEAVATFQMGNKVQQLKASTHFLVASPHDTEDPALALQAAQIASKNKEEERERLNEPSEDQKPLLMGSADNLQLASPPDSGAQLYRSPSLGGSGLFEPQPGGQLLTAHLGGSGAGSYSSGLGTPGSGLEASFAQQLDAQHQQQLQDDHLLAQLQHHSGAQQQQHQGDMQVDDAQAALHAHYANLAMQQSQSFQALSPGQMSYAPPPELVQTALQDAAGMGIDPASFASIHPNVLSQAASGTGTPAGVFHLHDMGQQPPFTHEPSTM
ncbi:hypothetical protein JCM9279_006046 [Rhodotorula babjevae]